MRARRLNGFRETNCEIQAYLNAPFFLTFLARAYILVGFVPAFAEDRGGGRSERAHP